MPRERGRKARARYSVRQCVGSGGGATMLLARARTTKRTQKRIIIVVYKKYVYLESYHLLYVDQKCKNNATTYRFNTILEMHKAGVCCMS